MRSNFVQNVNKNFLETEFKFTGLINVISVKRNLNKIKLNQTIYKNIWKTFKKKIIKKLSLLRQQIKRLWKKATKLYHIQIKIRIKKGKTKANNLIQVKNKILIVNLKGIIINRNLLPIKPKTQSIIHKIALRN